MAGDGITIGWGLQQSWQGYDSRCRDHCWSTDAGCLDEKGYQFFTSMSGRNMELLSGAIGSHLVEAENRLV